MYRKIWKLYPIEIIAICGLIISFSAFSYSTYHYVLMTIPVPVSVKAFPGEVFLKEGETISIKIEVSNPRYAYVEVNIILMIKRNEVELPPLTFHRILPPRQTITIVTTFLAPATGKYKFSVRIEEVVPPYEG